MHIIRVVTKSVFTISGSTKTKKHLLGILRTEFCIYNIYNIIVRGVQNFVTGEFCEVVIL
jgi:hypothetical protein